MQAPKDIERPKEGERRAFCRTGWGNDTYWYVMDDKGKIITSGDLYYAVKVVSGRVRP